MNAAWHAKHVMPANATVEQRIAWHTRHQQQCGCRPIPAKLVLLMQSRQPAGPETAPSAMKVAFGIKAHSGWAALVVVGTRGDELQVIDRRRIELVETADAWWAKQPYHAAVSLNADEARDLVGRGIAVARRIAVREVRAAIARADQGGHEVSACAVLMANPMPDWTVAEILAMHVRMHKAEGVLFRDALAHAADECGLRFVGVPEKQLHQEAERTLSTSAAGVQARIALLGKSAGPPWGRDQKEAALAALIALRKGTG